MITNVTETSVSILEVRDGENWRRAYVNSEGGRAELQADFPDAYEELCCEPVTDEDGNIVKGWWGTNPTVIFPPDPDIPDPVEPDPETTETDDVSWDAMAEAIMEGVNEV